MVEANTDPQVVTSRILRETRAAEEERRLEQPAPSVAEPVPEAPGTHAVETTPVPPPREPVDADAAYRHGRLAVVAAIVLVLLLVWLRQRRS